MKRSQSLRGSNVALEKNESFVSGTAPIPSTTASSMDNKGQRDIEEEFAHTTTIVVFGASGDLAKKKTYPALFSLYCAGLLPSNFNIVGYARSAKYLDQTVPIDQPDPGFYISENGKLPIDQTKSRYQPFRAHIHSHLRGDSGKLGYAKAFLSRCTYFQGKYDDPQSFHALKDYLEKVEHDDSYFSVNRLFYFAVPPLVFGPIAECISETQLDKPEINRSRESGSRNAKGWTRVVIEKPFGRNLLSYRKLSSRIGRCIKEKNLYRIDHYLGKEMVQNVLVLRFANTFLEPLWNRNNISTVQITFKEPFGTQGRGGYFDNYGIIRDVMQNHLMQVLSLIAMEPPVSIASDDVRDEKVKVLRSVQQVCEDHVVLGQYESLVDPDSGEVIEPGYLEDTQVPSNSYTPTFATVVLYINNPRWLGVPFILRAGKALNERKAEVRIQFHQPPNNLFKQMHSNELVLRIQPNEAVYMKMVTKTPGLSAGVAETELDLTYKSRFPNAYTPDAYERLIFDVMRGDQSSFVRDDELRFAWRIFDPILSHIDHLQQTNGPNPCHPYAFGSRGPSESDELIYLHGYRRSDTYIWKGPRDGKKIVSQQSKTKTKKEEESNHKGKTSNGLMSHNSKPSAIGGASPDLSSPALDRKRTQPPPALSLNVKSNSMQAELGGNQSALSGFRREFSGHDGEADRSLTRSTFTSSGTFSHILDAASENPESSRSSEGTGGYIRANLSNSHLKVLDQMIQEDDTHSHVKTASSDNPTPQYDSIKESFTLSRAQLLLIKKKMQGEMVKGLTAGGISSMKMIPTFVQKLPNGNEKGRYFALDMGGTNFRICEYTLDGSGGSVITREKKCKIPDDVMLGTSDALFGFIADAMLAFNVDAPCGFTFSFPIVKQRIDSGILVTWTKGFDVKNVVGRDVVSLLNAALKERGVKTVVTAVINDTVGTLAAHLLADQRTTIGLILGTGSNAAYIENIDNVDKWAPELRKKAKDAGLNKMVINMEWGGFGDGMPKGTLPRTFEDNAIDRHSLNPGKQLFEKMISGMYLGEITRRVLVRLMDGEYSLMYMYDKSAIEHDGTAKLQGVKRKLEDEYQISDLTYTDLFIVKGVCHMVATRAARLAATGIAAIVEHIDGEVSSSFAEDYASSESTSSSDKAYIPSKYTVAVDGSVFEHYPRFDETMRDTLFELKTPVKLQLCKDGSGKGAAIVAAGLQN
eukprot:g183.t1